MSETVLLVRHGQTTWNRDGRIQGWADASLTDRGRDQARAVGDHLRDAHDVDRLVVSDLRRTRETADVLADTGVDADVEFDAAWRERDFGELRGLTRAEIASRRPDFDPDESLIAVDAVPGGESLAAFGARVREGFESLATALDAGETAAVVTHGGPIRVALAAVTGRDLTAFAAEFSPANCGLTEIRLDDAGHVVACRDETAHLSV